MVAGDQQLVHTPFIPSGHWSPCAPLVWNQDFPTPLGGLSVSTDPVKAPNIRFSSSQFRRQHLRHEKATEFGDQKIFQSSDEIDANEWIAAIRSGLPPLRRNPVSPKCDIDPSRIVTFVRSERCTNCDAVLDSSSKSLSDILSSVPLPPNKTDANELCIGSDHKKVHDTSVFHSTNSKPLCTDNSANSTPISTFACVCSHVSSVPDVWSASSKSDRPITIHSMNLSQSDGCTTTANNTISSHGFIKPSANGMFDSSFSLIIVCLFTLSTFVSSLLYDV
ncbi:unnamed protein product [Schistosoma mattheei]|uniref:Uncharacterized protein n=1 Tax=Schistosoma mattheei TaxID=31246 RepID=A0A183NFY0_9TREM|nr:unnamed protein product [Schistosoma mattheei]